MKNTGIAIVSLVGGMIIGSALTMLFTPQSGPELRQKIKDSIDDEIDKVKDKLGKVEREIEEARCKCDENDPPGTTQQWRINLPAAVS